MKESLGDYKSAATAYKRAIAEAPAADLGLLEVCTPVVRGAQSQTSWLYLRFNQSDITSSCLWHLPQWLLAHNIKCAAGLGAGPVL